MFTLPENQPRPVARWGAFALLTALAFLSQGCMALHVRHPLPENLLEQVQIAGLPGIRDWGDVHSENLEQSAIESVQQELAANHGQLEPEVNFLALSGGGGDGAFGAGILCGWTEAGTRPRFKLVTGISTGALIAAFAFAGPEYDARLKEAYTTISDKDIYTTNSWVKMVLNLGRVDAAASTQPLAAQLERLIDENLFQAVAAGHRQGRRLLVGTTQLEAQRLVIWNLGAIAASHHPDALKLFRQVLRASASIPAAFNPVYIKVTAAGQEYDEMHVDGSIKAQVMLYGEAISFFTLSQKLGSQMPQRPRNLYLIRNATVAPEYARLKPNIWAIAPRAITSMTKSQGVGDLYRIYVLAQRDGIDFNLAFIPLDFYPKRASEFDTKYMNEEFEMAYNLARSGYKWHKYPPGMEPADLQPASVQQVQP